MPAMLFYSQNDSADEWKAGLQAHIPGLDFRVWPEIGAAEDIQFALVWRQPEGSLQDLPNLKCICSLGQGVDHVFADPKLPEGVQVMRLVDPWMSQAMSEWVLLNLLWFHRQGPDYEAFEREANWTMLPPPQTAERRIGIMGLGELGSDAARKIADLGFPTAGWSRSPKSIDGVESFHGDDGLDAFLARTDILCCLLPLTPATEGIINAANLAKLPKGAFVINSGRGQHVVDADLIAAIDSGHIAGAALDVFHQEPLPSDHPYWRHSKVRVWPHVSAQTNAASAVAQVADAITKVFAGETPNNLVDSTQRY